MKSVGDEENGDCKVNTGPKDVPLVGNETPGEDDSDGINAPVIGAEHAENESEEDRCADIGTSEKEITGQTTSDGSDFLVCSSTERCESKGGVNWPRTDDDMVAAVAG